METILLTIFSFTLLFIGISNRLNTFIRMLTLQGVLLFGITFLKLTSIRINKELYEQARQDALLEHRSISGQIELPSKDREKFLRFLYWHM